MADTMHVDPTSADPLQCLVCRRIVGAVGVLCTACSQAIARSDALPQQILAATPGDSDAGLVDQWGRLHALASLAPIGRDTVGGIAIFDNSVSRRHARIACIAGVWSVLDLDSSNGTRVNGERVTERVLAHGDRISFGTFELYLVCGIVRVAQAREAAETEAIAPLRAEERPAAPDALRIVETTGGGGIVELANASAQLTPAQLDLLEILSQRMRDEATLPISVRGYVRSGELVERLRWDTQTPNDTHVKQLVRRARRTLIRSGVGDLIEARQRFGYRLRVS